MVRKISTLGATLSLLRRRITDDEQGATAIEYAIIASGVGAAVAATVFNVGSSTKAMFANSLSLFQ